MLIFKFSDTMDSYRFILDATTNKPFLEAFNDFKIKEQLLKMAFETNTAKYAEPKCCESVGSFTFLNGLQATGLLFLIVLLSIFIFIGWRCARLYNGGLQPHTPSVTFRANPRMKPNLPRINSQPNLERSFTYEI